MEQGYGPCSTFSAGDRRMRLAVTSVGCPHSLATKSGDSLQTIPKSERPGSNGTDASERGTNADRGNPQGPGVTTLFPFRTTWHGTQQQM